MSSLSARDRGALIALLSLPSLGPSRLRSLLACRGTPADAWRAVATASLDGVPLRAGRARAELVARWRTAAAAQDPVRLLRAHQDAGIGVLAPTDPDWPAVLDDDPEPPALLFTRGDVGVLAVAGVAVVGTRRCSAHGAQVARSLGAGLAVSGLPVVSGLALGIDGAAHRGVLEAGGVPVGVVAGGLDRVYPPRNRDLWNLVAVNGVLVSEAALGVAPERWRFPARNRLIAAFARAVVVVESGRRGGSMSTVEAALDRDRDVFAVPGPVQVAASAGTNQLLFEGAALARDAADVLGHLGIDAAPVSLEASDPRSGGGSRPDAVLDAIGVVPVSADQIVAASGRAASEVLTALARLEAGGAVVRDDGRYRRVRSGSDDPIRPNVDGRSVR